MQTRPVNRLFQCTGDRMKTYQVVIESISRKTITVQAHDIDEAQDAAYDQWDGSTDGYSDNSILSVEEVTA